MKPNYKNWVPKTMIWGLMAATAIMLLCFFIFGIFGSFTGGGLRIALGIICLLYTSFTAVVHLFWQVKVECYVFGGPGSFQ